MARRSSRRLSFQLVALLAVALAFGPSSVAPQSAGFAGLGMVLSSEYPTFSRPAIAAAAQAYSAGQAIERHTSDFSGSYMRWPTTGKITQRYGCTGLWFNQPLGSCRHFHTGIDIANAKWTPIRAAAAGTVRFVGREPWGAWMVVIGHGGGLRSQYAHMVATRVQGVSEGRTVKKGQLIGYMGKTGMATGVHLHFEVKLNGRFVNPGRFLPDWSQ